ncbi:MAG: general stress protein, partial [Planctomycetaceae bacterium]
AGLLPAIGPVIAGGLLMSILASAAGGAAAGGLVGALIGLGIPEEEARFYDTEFRAGRTVVTVQAGDRYDEAFAICNRRGAYNANATMQRT